MGYKKYGHMISFDDQEYDDKSLEKLQREEKIIYRRGWCVPIQIDGDIVRLLKEDDGTIYLDGYLSFHKHWLDQIISGLQEAKRMVSQLPHA